MIIFDILLVSAVYFAWKLSRQPKRWAVLICLLSLGSITIYSYVLADIAAFFNFTQETSTLLPYWAALLTEFGLALVLYGIGTTQKAWHDRRYYFFLSSFLLISAIVTYLYTALDPSLYVEYHPLYASTTRALGIIHAIFMLALSDGIIESSFYPKMSRWFHHVDFRNNPH